ncbi:unnamed protein product [Ostreobium quekettii]|uniref:SBP-type domain-containing protein n=1 Tax=Ostreobium quekettii TaxID=121088 RepID=A0A8S1IXY4_9CHLO|nr:unnamed protein product [Ostreobium quekettii]
MAGMRGSGDGAGMANTDMLQQMLFEEGDPSTWRESEWHWNSLDLVAEPRVGQQPAACEAMKGGRNLVVQPGAEAMNSVPQMLETMPPSNTFQRGVDASACNFTSRAPSFPHTVFPPGTHSQPSRQELNPQFARTGSGLALPRVSSSHVETAMHTPQISGRDYEMPMDISDSDNLSRLSQMGNAGLAGGSVASMNTHSFPCMGPLPTSASAHRPTQPGVVFASPCANGGTGNEPCSMEETKVVESSGSPRTDLTPTSIPADVPVLASDTSNLQLVCQVSGCGMDLENLKEYHQRYRICDIHIKLPRVMKNGRLQRFCQQCGRFHDLVAFDGNRRSCRDQLNKHNARRRKRASQKLKPEMAEVESFAEDDSEVGRFLQGLCKNPGHLRALRLLLGLPLNPALPPQCPMPAPFTSRAPGAPGKCSELCQCDVGTADVAIEDQSDECVDARPCPCSSSNAKSSSGKPPTPADVPVSAVQPSPQCPSSEDGTPCDITTYSLARKMVSCKEDFSATFETDERLQRLSLKLFNKTPSSLPAGLKEDILSWLGSAPTMMEGMIAPGGGYVT